MSGTTSFAHHWIEVFEVWWSIAKDSNPELIKEKTIGD